MGIFNLIPNTTIDNQPIPLYRSSNTTVLSAEELMEAYRLHPNRLKNSNDETVKGFTVDLSHLGIDKKIFIAFGVNPSDLSNHNLPWEQKGFTTIIFELGGTSSDTIENSKKPIDFCDPCPQKCPIEIGHENPPGTFTKKLQLCNDPSSPTCQ